MTMRTSTIVTFIFRSGLAGSLVALGWFHEEGKYRAQGENIDNLLAVVFAFQTGHREIQRS